MITLRALLYRLIGRLVKYSQLRNISLNMMKNHYSILTLFQVKYTLNIK